MKPDMSTVYKEMKTRIAEGLETKPYKTKLVEIMDYVQRKHMLGRKAQYPSFGQDAITVSYPRFKTFEEARNELRRMREYSVKHLRTLMKDAEKIFTKGRVKVFFAEYPEDAINYILEQIGDEKIVLTTHSKSHLEFDLEPGLEERGVKVIRTGIQDRTTRVLGMRYDYLYGGSKMVEYDAIPLWAKAMSILTGKTVKPELEEVSRVHTALIREAAEEAQTGITSANFIAARDGYVVIAENQANIRLCSALPRHIILVPIDKLVPTLEDAIFALRMGMTQGHQETASYINTIGRPSSTHSVREGIAYGMQGALEVHLVLVDNGRTQAVGTDFEEALYCLGTICGSCNNFCPLIKFTNETVSYKQSHFGPECIMKTAIIGRETPEKKLMTSINHGLFLCTNCRACYYACPCKIDTPKMIQKLRQEAVERGLVFPPLKEMLDSVKSLGNPFNKSPEHGVKLLL